jgi:DNA-binding IclR family transcriptional regulator
VISDANTFMAARVGPTSPLNPREANYTGQRVLRALEVLVMRPTSAPGVAAKIGVHPRTARRILLYSLAVEQYVEHRGGRGRGASDYCPTARLLAMAGQLASQLPLVEYGRDAVREIEHQTELTAYVVVPCYLDVLVIACTVARALQPWTTLPASTDAAGRVLSPIATLGARTALTSNPMSPSTTQRLRRSAGAVMCWSAPKGNEAGP